MSWRSLWRSLGRIFQACLQGPSSEKVFESLERVSGFPEKGLTSGEVRELLGKFGELPGKVGKLPGNLWIAV